MTKSKQLILFFCLFSEINAFSSLFNWNRSKKEQQVFPIPHKKQYENPLFSMRTGINLGIGDSTRIYYSYRDKIPLLAIEKLDCPRFRNPEVHKRTDPFGQDTRIPRQFRAKTSFYHNNNKNVDRGHLAPAADFRESHEEYNESFKYSNIFPQNRDLNRNVWQSAENLARELVIYQGIDTLYVYSGNVVYSQQCGGDEECQRVANVLGNEDAHSMSIPSSLFKIYYGIKSNNSNNDDGNDDERYIFAFLLPNAQVEMYENVLIDNSVTIDQLERLSGFELPSQLKEESNKSLCDRFKCTVNTADKHPINLCEDDL